MAVLLAGCAPAGGQPNTASGPRDQAPQIKKRITVAVRGEAPLIWGGTGAVGEWVIDMFNSPLVAFDPPGNPTALLAESAPTLENGQWKLFPDGRMETTITIRPAPNGMMGCRSRLAMPCSGRP